MRISEGDLAGFVGEASLKGHRWLPSIDGAQGVLFRCPLPDCTHMVLVWFANPRNAPLPPSELTPTPRWQMSGSCLDDLTLSPSVFLNGPGCGWHGWVQNGEAKSAGG